MDDDNNPRQLAPIAAKPLTLSDLRISTRLRGLLFGDVPREVAIAEIRGNNLLSVEVQAIANELRKIVAPAGDQAVREAMQTLILVYGATDSARASTWWKVYYQALRDFPMSALVQAVQDYASSPESRYFPKPGQLKALAMKAAEPLYQAAARAKTAAEGPAVRSKAPDSDARSDALRRAQELEREVPTSIRTKLPFSQWPEEYRAKIEEADRLRADAR